MRVLSQMVRTIVLGTYYYYSGVGLTGTPTGTVQARRETERQGMSHHRLTTVCQLRAARGHAFWYIAWEPTEEGHLRRRWKEVEELQASGMFHYCLESSLVTTMTVAAGRHSLSGYRECHLSKY